MTRACQSSEIHCVDSVHKILLWPITSHKKGERDLAAWAIVSLRPQLPRSDIVQEALPEEIRRAEFSIDDRELGRPELTPLGKCSGAVELEIVP